MPKTRSYKNGDCEVVIRSDGTKMRVGENPALPESIDLKITNQCTGPDNNQLCAFCHEASNPRGSHGDIDFILKVISQMQRGTELAIGGGNPLEHPELERILIYARSRGVYANLTVNHEHVRNDWIEHYLDRNLLAGVGISMPETSWKIPPDIYKLYCAHQKRVVFHVINGIHTAYHIRNMVESFYAAKFLVLGYKIFGMGKKYSQDNPGLPFLIEHDHNWITQFLEPGHHFSFDNLAVEQLRLREKLPPEKFDSQYMGEDGQFTMYVDAVTKRYAVSSTSERFPVNSQTLLQIFERVRTS